MNRITSVSDEGIITYTMRGIFTPKPDEEFLDLICQEDPNYKELLQLWLDKKIIGKRYTMWLTLNFFSESISYISFKYEIE